MVRIRSSDDPQDDTAAAAGDVAATLADALDRIAAGESSVLIVQRLRDVAGSLGELVGVIEWLRSAGAELVAEDVDLDTGSADAQRVLTVLREIAGWRGRPGSGRPARGRPGMDRLAPELTERIARMREAGATLQAIADALNADGVPTPRGGVRWRPSSVQSVLGYRRPRPPAPGLPPLPPHAPRQSGPHPDGPRSRPDGPPHRPGPHPDGPGSRPTRPAPPRGKPQP